MVFKSDKQRKAVMAKMNQPNQPRSPNQPTFLGRVRRRFKPTPEELAQQRGARIQREAQQLQQQRQRTRQLELEARLETEREGVRQREQTARKRLSEIDKARFQRTFTGKAVTRGRELGRAGIQRLQQEAAKPKRRRRRAKPQREPAGPFGIEF